MSTASFVPEPGTRFGRLVVLDTDLRTEPRKPGHVGLRRFLCGCDCGQQIIIDPAALKGGYSRSCGCLRREKGRERGKASRRHGMWNHPLYKTWNSMVHRCHDAMNPAYDRYGGRGVTVHGPWRESPEDFIRWMDRHLGERPDGHSLDRIDNDGNYEPGNLRWADSTTQNNNRRPAQRSRWSQDIELSR